MNKNTAIILLTSTLAIAGVSFYFYRKYSPYTPSQNSVKYNITIKLQD